MFRPDNKLKLIRNLMEKRSARRKEGLFVVEGPHLVAEAGERIKFVAYAENFPILKELEAKGIPCLKISSKQFAEISDVETPQGILAIVKEPEGNLFDMLKAENTLIVFCIGVQDPGNLGTIIRSADAFGASGVILSRGTVDLYNPKVLRSSMGSIFHLPIVRMEDEGKTIAYLKQNNVKIIVTDPLSGEICFSADMKGALAVLIGNEGSGLPAEIVKLADEVVKVPMPGKAESLNVGISVAVFLYESLRQRTHGR